MNRGTLLSIILLAAVGCNGGGKQSADSGDQQNQNEQKKSLKVDISKLKNKNKSSNVKSTIRFEDVREEMGLSFVYQNGQKGQSLMVETTGSGNGWIDYDRDGHWDLYLNQGGDPTLPSVPSQPNDNLFRLVDGRFESVIEDSGILELGYSQGVAVGDFNNDGFDDIYVTNTGRNTLFQNQGDGSFQEVAIATGVGDGERWSSSAAWADIDLDGDLDLYVCNYTQYNRFKPHPCVNEKTGKPGICHPKHVSAWPDACYINQGDGTFVDEARKRGLYGKGNKALGVAIADFNKDGWPDIYVANDTTANFLFINDQNGNFEEVAMAQGCATDRAGSFQASMGLGIYDFDRNEFLDIYSTHYEEESNTLYRNNGKFGFEDVTAELRIHDPTVPWLGFGTIMDDFDRNSYADIFVAHGHVNNTPDYHGKQKMKAGLYTFDGDMFHDVTKEGGSYFDKKLIGRGTSVCDFDQDGDLDLLVNNQNDEVGLLRNDSPEKSYLKLQFVGIDSARNGIGVKAKVTAGELTLFHELVAGTSYLSTNQPILIFGFDDHAGPIDVEIKWPRGDTQTLKGIEINQDLIVFEGGGAIPRS